MSDQLRVQEMNDELITKDRKVATLESKLLKAYQRIEKLNDEYENKIKNLIYDGERARDDLTRCVDKIQQLEHELDETRAAAQKGDHTNEQEYHELRDKIWKQERELQESRTLLTRLREKELEFERMRSEKGYLELKNENLNKKLEQKKRAVEELERSVSTLRLEQTICQQSCSSGSTPLADEMETMSDIRPSLARPYTKAHSTMGSHMSPLSHSKSSGLTKSFSNFALNSSKRDDITPMMSRTIREQDRHITMCRAMVACLKDTVDRMARGENPDVARLLGVKLNMMSESEMDDDEDFEADESKPFSMMSAESAVRFEFFGTSNHTSFFSSPSNAANWQILTKTLTRSGANSLTGMVRRVPKAKAIVKFAACSKRSGYQDKKSKNVSNKQACTFNHVLLVINCTIVLNFPLP